MTSSRRNRLIDIEKPSETTDALNEPSGAWEVVFAGLWASIAGPGGLGAIRESNGGVPDGSSPYSIEINYRPTGIHEGMRVNCGGQFFNIAKIRHDFVKKQSTWLICTHGGNDG